MTELYDGLVAASQNRFPSLGFDVMSLTAPLQPVFAAGFYYKTFMWPASFWEKVYEPIIRHAAGLGRGAALPDPDRYERCFAFCDVLVVGAGPAGLSATRTAARSGARVILCDEDFALGGRLLAERLEIDGMQGPDWARRIAGELAGMPNVTLMPRTTVFGSYDHGVFGALERVADHFPEPPPYSPRQRLWEITTRRTVLSAGATERPIAFAANDLPGIMLAGAVRSYANRFGAMAGQRVAVFTNNDDGWKTVESCVAAGMTLVAVIDSRPDPGPVLRAIAERAGAAVIAGGAGPRGERWSSPFRDRGGQAWWRHGAVRCRSACRFGWLESRDRAHLAPWHQAGLGHPAGRPSAGSASRWHARRRCCRGRADARPLPRRRHLCGCTSRSRLRLHAIFRLGPDGVQRERRRDRALAGRGRPQEELRRFPERRDGRRRRAGASRRFPRGRASEALHDARHGDRPGPHVEHGRSRNHGGADGAIDSGSRHHHLSAALHAGRDLGLRRPSQGPEFPADTLPAGASLVGGAWCQLCARRPVVAAGMVRPGRRERLDPDRRPRGPLGPRTCGNRGRLDTRQDRRAGGGRRQIPRPHLLQPDRQPANRQGALCADAARGRHRHG